MAIAYGTVTKLTFDTGDQDIEGLADGSFACSNMVTPSTEINAVLFQFRITVNASSAPDDNSLIEIYFIRSIDSNLTGGITESAADTDDDFLERCGTFIKAFRVRDTVNETYIGEALVLLPGETFGVAVVNKTGQALAGDGTHEVNYQEITW